MLRRFRFVLRPGWLVLHVIALAMIVTMILLGRWQLHVSERKHFSIQNFGYSLQWWAFSIFTALMWLRIVRDQARRDEQPDACAEPVPAQDAPVAYRRYVMPAPAVVTDPELLAYNDYLQRLDEKDRR